MGDKPRNREISSTTMNVSSKNSFSQMYTREKAFLSRKSAYLHRPHGNGPGMMLHELSMRKRLVMWLDSSHLLFALDLTDAAFSVTAVILYVAESYDLLVEHRLEAFIIELCLATFFAAFLILQLYLSEVRLRFLRKPITIVDMMTIVPVFVELVPAVGPQMSFFGFLRAVRVVRVLRILRIHRMIEHTDSEVQRQVFLVVFTVACICFCTAGLLQTAEQEQDLMFHDAVYLTIITISTVGYGDFAPIGVTSRVIICCMLAFTFIIVPYQMNELSTMLSRDNIYLRTRFVPRYQRSHVVICGSFSLNTILEFLKEFFHDDHGYGTVDVCLVCATTPSRQLEIALQAAKFPRRVVVLEGNMRYERDCQRAAVRDSRAVFFVCNKYCESYHEEDANVIMRVLSMQHFLRNHPMDSYVRMFVQVNLPSSKEHLLASISHNPTMMLCTSVLCINEIKLNMLGHSLSCPGLSTLLCNLIVSADDADVASKAIGNSSGWHQEYWHGASQEIYRCPFPPCFQGLKFREAARVVYEQTGAVLFGLELKCHDGVAGGAGAQHPAQRDVLLAPLDYKITDVATTLGFLVAKDVRTSILVSNLKEEDAEMYGDAATARAQTTTGMSLRWVKDFSRTVSDLHLVPRRADGTFGIDPVRAVRNSIVSSQSVVGRALSSLAAASARLSWFSTAPDSEARAQGDSTPNSGAQPKRISKKESLALSRTNQRTGHQLWALIRVKHIKVLCNWQPGQGIANQMQRVMKRLTNLTRHFALRAPLELHEVTLKSVPFSGHVVIVGSIKGLFHIIAPLRRKHMELVSPIVLMSDSTPLPKWWDEICLFPSVYFMEGHALQLADLERVNIRGARQVIICARDSSLHQQTAHHDGQEYLQDADTVFIYKHIISVNPNIEILVELVNGSNMNFLMNQKDSHVDMANAQLAAPYMAGQVLLISMLDSLLCQSYFNSDLIPILLQLLRGHEYSGFRRTQSAASCATSFADISDTSEYPPITAQIRVEEAFIGGEFRSYYHYLLQEKDMICLGLYRAAGSNGNNQPYVLTNPKGDTQLLIYDRAFVLTRNVDRYKELQASEPPKGRIKATTEKYKRKEPKVDQIFQDALLQHPALMRARGSNSSRSNRSSPVNLTSSTPMPIYTTNPRGAPVKRRKSLTQVSRLAPLKRTLSTPFPKEVSEWARNFSQNELGIDDLNDVSAHMFATAPSSDLTSALSDMQPSAPQSGGSLNPYPVHLGTGSSARSERVVTTRNVAATPVVSGLGLGGTVYTNGEFQPNLETVHSYDNSIEADTRNLSRAASLRSPAAGPSATSRPGAARGVSPYSYARDVRIAGVAVEVGEKKEDGEDDSGLPPKTAKLPAGSGTSPNPPSPYKALAQTPAAAVAMGAAGQAGESVYALSNIYTAYSARGNLAARPNKVSGPQVNLAGAPELDTSNPDTPPASAVPDVELAQSGSTNESEDFMPERMRLRSAEATQRYVNPPQRSGPPSHAPALSGHASRMELSVEGSSDVGDEDRVADDPGPSRTPTSSSTKLALAVSALEATVQPVPVVTEEQVSRSGSQMRGEAIKRMSMNDASLMDPFTRRNPVLASSPAKARPASLPSLSRAPSHASLSEEWSEEEGDQWANANRRTSATWGADISTRRSSYHTTVRREGDSPAEGSDAAHLEELHDASPSNIIIPGANEEMVRLMFIETLHPMLEGINLMKTQLSEEILAIRQELQAIKESTQHSRRSGAP